MQSHHSINSSGTLLERVGHLEGSLPAGWGGDGSHLIHPTVAREVRVFLRDLRPGFLPLPRVVSPTFEGGLQLE